MSGTRCAGFGYFRCPFRQCVCRMRHCKSVANCMCDMQGVSQLVHATGVAYCSAGLRQLRCVAPVSGDTPGVPQVIASSACDMVSVSQRDLATDLGCRIFHLRYLARVAIVSCDTAFVSQMAGPEKGESSAVHRLPEPWERRRYWLHGTAWPPFKLSVKPIRRRIEALRKKFLIVHQGLVSTRVERGDDVEASRVGV